jgi:Protein of unknown function (DUF1566)
MKKFTLIQTAATIFAGLNLVQTALAQTSCNANLPLTRPNSRYEVVTGSNGVEVRDKVTKLIWQRCAVSQSWDGSGCGFAGFANTYTWTQALDAARTAAPSPVVGASTWRVPNYTELLSLAERACGGNTAQSINTYWFPDTPTAETWSSSPAANSANSARLYDFSQHYGYVDAKSASYYVRLVRSGP